MQLAFQGIQGKSLHSLDFLLTNDMNLFFVGCFCENWSIKWYFTIVQSSCIKIQVFECHFILIRVHKLQIKWFIFCCCFGEWKIVLKNTRTWGKMVEEKLIDFYSRQFQHQQWRNSGRVVIDHWCIQKICCH